MSLLNQLIQELTTPRVEVSPKGDRVEDDESWWRTYTIYLKTPGWKAMRLKVLKRDKYICQACLVNEAVQVHHVSYKLYNRIGSSAAFELVAICFPCHSMIHPRIAEAQPKTSARRATKAK